jgi:hypothetical protein
MAATSTAWGESMRTRHQGILQLFACLSCSAVWPAFGQTPQVELTLQCQTSAKATDLRMALRNTGTIDANLVLGITLGNGREYIAETLILEVKRRDGDDVESYQYSDPDRSYAIAGRVDPWIVPLPAGSEFSITRPLNQFHPRVPGASTRVAGQLSLEGGAMDLRLKLISRPQDRPRGDDTVGPGLVHVMPGELQSQWIHVPEECKAG